MKKILVFVLTLTLGLQMKADEGMWLLPLIEKLNIDDMKRMGFEMDASDIYSPDKPGLKDAIVIFGRGCTAELISDQGLILTNHHCGYSTIQSHSSVEHDYLKDGFWAMSREEEIPSPGLSITFIRDIFDVTERVMDAVTEDMPQYEYKYAVDSVTQQLKEEYTEKSGMDVIIKSFYSGNQYYAFLTEKYNDVRFVGAPPSSIGKFGADTDNWMWPRHTGDFSMFRVYADKDGKPAEYSADNVPLKPRYHLPVSLAGVEMDDFAMTLGFPGSTNRYLTSWGIDERMNIINDARIVVRKAKQDVWLADMRNSDEVRIGYASKYARSSNYYKNSIGMNRGLENLQVPAKKASLEQDFETWVENSHEGAKYAEVIPLLKEGYEGRKDAYKAYAFYKETFISGVEIFSFALQAKRLAELAETGNDSIMETSFASFKEAADKFYKDYSPETDRKTLTALLEVYANEINKDYYPAIYDEIKDHEKIGYARYAHNLFRKSVFTNPDAMYAVIEKKDAKTIAKDPVMEAAKLVEAKMREISATVKPFEKYIEKGNRLFEAGLQEMKADKVFYPDANFTMRMSYGKVGDYNPRDGVNYKHYTTLKGVMEKEDPDNWEFVVPAKLKELYETKDYGQYADSAGYMPVCFTTNNDITGGNSGSPVINAKGELFGLAFDGNWEAMSGDIAFEPELQKCINVDIRYVLFIIDKFAGASHLIDEMTLEK